MVAALLQHRQLSLSELQVGVQGKNAALIQQYIQNQISQERDCQCLHRHRQEER